MKLLKSNDGFALVATLLIIVITLTLVTVLINISLSEYKQAELNKNDVKAYYLARSGAEMVADYMINKNDTGVTNLELDSNSNVTFDVDENGDKISSIEIVKNNDNDYDIISTANVNNKSKTVKVNIIRKKSDLFDAAIFAKTNLNFSKMTDVDVKGKKVETNGDTITDPDDYIPDDKEVVNSEKEFQSIIWDSSPTIQQTISDQSGSGISIKKDYTLTEDTYFTSIDYNNQDTLTVDFSSVTPDANGNETINIVVEDMDFKGNMTFVNDTDGSHLNIFVKDEITFQTPNVDIPNINIFLSDQCEDITLIANSSLPDDEGIFVYGPDSDMIMQSNKTTFSGTVIVNSFEGQGDLAMGNYYYEAFSDVDQDYIQQMIDQNITINFEIAKWYRN